MELHLIVHLILVSIKDRTGRYCDLEERKAAAANQTLACLLKTLNRIWLGLGFVVPSRYDLLQSGLFSFRVCIANHLLVKKLFLYNNII